MRAVDVGRLADELDVVHLTDGGGEAHAEHWVVVDDGDPQVLVHHPTPGRQLDVEVGAVGEQGAARHALPVQPLVRASPPARHRSPPGH